MSFLLCGTRWLVKGYIRKSHVLFAMKEYGKSLQAIELVRLLFCLPTTLSLMLSLNLNRPP